ncbi:endo-1,4-beta-xylanase [Luteimicrobium xylanilyticum]|uniref:Beta-xylanase n=1 Tax=Luteimicrobium xylanilyticum TaxID=1133546 RepID=A0A5P9QF90_9MICO|nr:endo-1,4-beta-xylanase [Luteimicrobium xylanilyticum]QFV00132.1 Endo-1,4-beta-xylanase [Luteimicrobium xylanilyticum]
MATAPLTTTSPTPRRHRRAIVLGAGIAVVGLVAAPLAASAHGGSPWGHHAVPGAPSHGHKPPTQPTTGDDTLRSLAAPSGLRIGAAINTDKLGTDDAYTTIAGEQFSTVSPENVMKWDTIEPTQGTYNFAPADKLVAFAQQHGQLVRGHTLVWHNQLPSWLTAEADSLTADQLRAILKKHIQTEVKHFKGKIWQWDVVNEAFADDGTLRDDIWSQKLGDSYIADAFRWAHEADPKAKLFYNDYNIEYTGAKSEAVYAMVKKLQAQGVPIDGVGFQDHLDTQYGTPNLQETMQKFADLGLDTAVTEADVRTTLPVTTVEQTAQNSMWSQSLSACLLVKRCISFTVWGIDDGSSWVPSTFEGEGAALLWDDDFQPKAQFGVLQQTLELAAGAPRRTR